jgi:hypothetical protein
LVPNFAKIAKPLSQLTRKGQEFSWGPRQQEAFESLKERLCATPVLGYPNFKLPFILTTDGSKTAIGAILSQIQDGVERPLAYTSRQLNMAKHASSASEVELLALVWATKYFSCYLFGAKFVVKTDHAALTYLRNFADHNSRLLRWSIRLSEMDVVVQHRPAAKTAYADALSRHIGTVTHKNCIDKETIIQEQSRDAFCSKQTPGSYSVKKEFILDEEGAMYRRQRNGNHQLVIPEVLVQDIIKENHSPLFAAHPGVHRIYSLIALNY